MEKCVGKGGAGGWNSVGDCARETRDHWILSLFSSGEGQGDGAQNKCSGLNGE